MNDVLWAVVGFLAGVVIWMPFLIKVQMDRALFNLRAELLKEISKP